MISKSQIKLITSLAQKKYRVKTGLFTAEGPKIIKDLLEGGLKLEALFSTEDASHLAEDWVSITAQELKKISSLKTANSMLALFHIPNFPIEEDQGLVLALDAVRDPGNLGTIIRLCDWFGVQKLVCSMDTVDCFNPKVIQATMGSIARVEVSYRDLRSFIEKANIPVYGAVMNGENVYGQQLPADAILVMGNEANGISDVIQKGIDHKITIPVFSNENGPESLNVATATGILLSEFRRTTER